MGNKYREREIVYEKFYDYMENEDDNNALNYLNELQNSKYGLDTKCPHCYRKLLKSDVKGYHSVCLWCNENFFSIEEVL